MMKTLLFLLTVTSILLFTSGCKKADPGPCTTKTTLLNKDVLCIGALLMTEDGEKLLVGRPSAPGQNNPLLSDIDNLEEGDEFYIDYQGTTPGPVCEILPPPIFNGAQHVWITCYGNALTESVNN